MTADKTCRVCGASDPNDRYSKYDESGNAIVHKKRRPCDNSDFHGPKGDGKRGVEQLGTSGYLQVIPPAPPDSRGGVEEAREDNVFVPLVRIARHVNHMAGDCESGCAFPDDPRIEADIVIREIKEALRIAIADAARQANERADRLCTALRERDRISADVERAMEDAARQALEDSPDRDWRRQMESYGFDSVAKTLDMMEQARRQARAEVAGRVHVAGCDCVAPGAFAIEPERADYDGRVDSACLAERERVKQGR